MKKNWPSLTRVGMAMSVFGALGVLGMVGTASATTSSQEWAVHYTGGTAGPAKSGDSPITIGVIEPIGAQAGSYPGYPQIVTAAEKYIDNQLGGVGGHPLKLSVCDVTDSQDAQTCGEQFANNSSISVVVNGNLDFDDTSELSALSAAGVPVMLPVAITSAELGDAKAANYGPGLTNFFPAFTSYIQQAGDGNKPISVLVPNNAPGVGSEDILKPLFAAANITHVTYATAPLGGTAPQYVSAVQAAGAAHAAAVIVLAPDVACVDIEQALKTQGASSSQLFMATEGCLDSLVFSHYGGHVPTNWRIFNFGNSPLVPGLSTGVNSYVAATTKYAPNAAADDPDSAVFGTIVTADKLLNSVGFSNVSRASMMKAMLDFTGPAMMEPGKFKCGFVTTSPAVCGNSAAVDHWTGSKYAESTVSVRPLS